MPTKEKAAPAVKRRRRATTSTAQKSDLRDETNTEGSSCEQADAEQEEQQGDEDEEVAEEVEEKQESSQEYAARWAFCVIGDQSVDQLCTPPCQLRA